MIHLLPINSEIVLQNSRPPGTNVHWLVSHISCILMHFTHLYGILPWESILRRNWVSRGGPIATQSMLPGLDGMTTNGNTWLKGNTAFSSVAGIWCGKDVASEMLFSWQRSGQQHSRICVLLSTRRWQSSRGPKRHCCEEFQCHKSGTWLVWVCVGVLSLNEPWTLGSHRCLPASTDLDDSWGVDRDLQISHMWIPSPFSSHHCSSAALGSLGWMGTVWIQMSAVQTWLVLISWSLNIERSRAFINI